MDKPLTEEEIDEAKRRGMELYGELFKED